MPALEPTSLTAQTLSVDLDQARAALTELDRAALAAIGIDAVTLDPPSRRRGHRDPGSAD